MSDDYFTRLDRQLAQLTMAGAHLDPGSRWSLHRWDAVERAARRTAVVIALAIVLAAALVIEFPGSASGRVHRSSVFMSTVAAHPDRGAVAITAAGVGGRNT